MDYATHFRPVIEVQGEAVTWVHGTGTGATTGTVTGIYRKPFEPAVLGGLSVDATLPSLVVMSADVPNVARGDSLTIRGQAFTVRVPKPDLVTGITELELQGP